MTLATPAATSLPRRMGQWLSGQAYLLLTLTSIMWAGNAIASKLAVGEVSPMVLTCLRWVITCAILAAIARKPVRTEWRLLLPRWKLILLMGTLGFTAFNALFYAAGAYTSAVNLTLFQGSIPVLVLIGSLVAYRMHATPLQIVGVATTLIGVVVAATQGDLATLTTLAFNRGDVFMVLASLLYAGYTVGLPSRPKVSGIVFFSAMAAVACITSIPLLVVEITQGAAIWPTPMGLAILLYVGIFPSLVSQLFFMRGVELIGPNRAGVFVNLVPVLGPLCAVVLLGERFEFYHAVALTLVLGGIYVAERMGRLATI